VTGPIIRAQVVEKFYLQPGGNRIEVIAPVDLDVRLIHEQDFGPHH
jgi:hypothetical protein